MSHREAVRAAAARVTERTSVDVSTTALLLDTSVNRLYGRIRATGEVCDGIGVIRVGSRIRVPARPLARVLGLLDEEA